MYWLKETLVTTWSKEMWQSWGLNCCTVLDLKFGQEVQKIWCRKFLALKTSGILTYWCLQSRFGTLNTKEHVLVCHISWAFTKVEGGWEAEKIASLPFTCEVCLQHFRQLWNTTAPALYRHSQKRWRWKCFRPVWWIPGQVFSGASATDGQRFLTMLKKSVAKPLQAWALP